jgi:hypothetical protein
MGIVHEKRFLSPSACKARQERNRVRLLDFNGAGGRRRDPRRFQQPEVRQQTNSVRMGTVAKEKNGLCRRSQHPETIER